jgi:hypothetical protein
MSTEKYYINQTIFKYNLIFIIFYIHSGNKMIYFLLVKIKFYICVFLLNFKCKVIIFLEGLLKNTNVMHIVYHEIYMIILNIFFFLLNR